jgi:uncharacterized protein
VKADAKPKARGSLKGEIYRQSRLWHGYLSAFAFLALIFFAVTGLLLNHPEWVPAKEDPKPLEATATVSPADLKAAQASADPAKTLAEALRKQVKLRGAYQSGEVMDGEAQIRLEGPTGSSDIFIDLATGKAEITVAKAGFVTTINELHRGKNAGAAWKAVIDASAILVLALSVIGYVLFFSLRFRLRTSLILTGASLAVLVGIIWLFVP